MGKSDKKKYWIGFDLGGTKMMACLFNDDFKVLAREKKKTKAHEGVEAGLERIETLLQTVLDAAKVSKDELAGIGCGCAGPVDHANGIIATAPNLGWNNVKLRKKLETVFGCEITVLNDADAGAYGEFKLGAGRGKSSVLGVFPGTGIGGGYIHEGMLVRAGSISCFEFGHLPLIPNGARCGCGQRGCLETVASRLAIGSAAAAAVYRGEAPHLALLTGADVANMRSGALAQAIKEGDASIERIVRDSAKWLGVGISGIINLLAPQVVVLGGGLTEAMPDIYKEEVEAACRRRVMSTFKNMYAIELSQLMDDAIATGAACFAADQAAAKAD